MASKVAIDNVPTVARPTEIERAISEANGLRAQHRQTREEVAAKQAELERLQEDDVTATAERVRAGGTPSPLPAALAKARAAAELAERNACAIGLASEAAQVDLSRVITEHADGWVVELGNEIEQARESGRAAVAKLEEVCARISTAASARNWLSDGRFDTRPPGVITASTAPSSRGRTANSEALQRGGYVRELLDPPIQTRPKTLRVETPEPLDDVERTAIR